MNDQEKSNKDNLISEKNQNLDSNDQKNEVKMNNINDNIINEKSNSETVNDKLNLSKETNKNN